MLNDEPNANEESQSKKNGGHQFRDQEYKYGWCNVHPGFMQVMLKPVVCLLVLIGCTSTAVMLAHMMPGVKFTLKQRYKITDKQLNGLNVAQGISLMVAVVIVGFFGNFRARKIPCIAIGMALAGLGGIFFAIPHFRSDAYKPLDFPEFMLNGFGLCMRAAFPCTDENVDSAHMAFFVIGQILIGVGIAPLFCLAPAYIDENINPKWMPIAMLVYYANLSLGPVNGFIGGGVFQQSYIDIEQPKLKHQIEPDDFRWLGAWWLSYLVFGVITIFSAFIVAGFPAFLPGSQARRDEHILKGDIPTDDNRINQSPEGVFHVTSTLLKNTAFLFNTLANICIVFFIFALGPFMLQVVMIKYGADPFKIIMPVTTALFFGLVVGIVVGGYLTNRIGVKNLAKRATFLCLATSALCILAPLLFVVPGCEESNLAGVTKEYPALGGVAMPKMGKNGSSEITAQCNMHCKCSTFFSKPVCGSNNVAYFDSCHAGCMLRPTKDDYANCTCIPPSVPGMKYGTAKKGFCDRSCGSWKVFLFVGFLAVALFGANIVPSRVVVLRCVQNNQRSYALALQAFLFTLVAFIPTYLVTYIMHHDCNIWQKDPCGRKGMCLDYHTKSMSKSMTIFGLVVTALATTFYFFSWHVYKPPKTMKTNRLLSDTSAAPDDDDGKETKL